MKTTVLLLFTVLNLAAQDATLEQPPKSATEALRAEQRRLETERQRAERLLNQKPVITYGGFLKDVRDSSDKKRFFSFRQTVDPRRDYKNLLYDPDTARPKGFVLFSLSF